MLRRLFGLLVLVLPIAAFCYLLGAATVHYDLPPWNDFKRMIGDLYTAARGGPLKPPERAQRVIATGLLNLDMTILNDGTPIEGRAGGLAVGPDGVLITRDADGGLAYYDRDSDALRTLAIGLPSTNWRAIPERTPSGRRIMLAYVRHHDVELFTADDGTLHLAATYAHYDEAQACFTIRLAEAPLPGGWDRPATGPEDRVELDWRQLFEALPCLPFSEDRNTFGGNQSGGRIVAEPAGTLLFTTGDIEFDGLGRKQPRVSQAETGYGRIFRADPATGIVTELSKGHRNPQGLTYDVAGRLWEVEHGAMGGDELNLIVPGTNYGWPEVTLGVSYVLEAESDAKYWPLQQVQGRHDGYAGPVHAWIPSVAPSSLVAISGFHPRWDGDLLVGGLASQALRRLRLEGDHVLYDEPIRLANRVRDLAVGHGRIYIVFDDGRFGYFTAHEMGEASDYDPLVSNRLADLGCLSCHGNPTLPGLAGVAGRDIASQPGIAYSEALRRLEGHWTAERLAQFLADPQAAAPGTTMPDPGLSEADIAALIAELAALTEEHE